MGKVDLSYPFSKAFEVGASIDYKSTKDHQYVKERGYEPEMGSDCSYSAKGLKGFSLSSYGDWGTFYTDWAGENEKEMFLDMVSKGIITLWRIRIYVKDGKETICHDYDDDEKRWICYNGEAWVECEDPFVKYKM